MIDLANTPVLTTERLTLRAPLGADWEQFRPFFTSPRAEFIRGDDDSARFAWRAFGHVIGHWAMRGFGTFVFHRTGDPTPLGGVGPWYPEGWPEKEIGWTVWDPTIEGTGLAHEAVLAARAHAFDDLGWDTAVSYIDPDNTRSIALAERLGATRDDDADCPFEDGTLVYRHHGVAP